jgi:M6 family metalloprotease-like protein
MKRTTFLWLLALAAFPAWAVQHVVPGTYPHAVQDMIHHPSAARVHAAGSVLAALTSGSVGTKKIAVLVIQFPAGIAGLTSGSNSIISPVNIQNNFTQMAAYYSEVSYGKLTLNIRYLNADVVSDAVNGDAALHAAGAYRFDGTGGLPNHPMEYYGCGDEGEGSVPPCSGVTTPAIGANGNYLLRDAIVAARNKGYTGLVSTEKDPVNGFDAVIVVHAGNGNETTPCRGAAATNGDIWSIFYSQDSDVIGGQSPANAQAAAARFSEGDVVPETEFACRDVTSPMGVMCHEFGHALGLPDLYNTSAIGGSSVVGNWELMDAGPYDGPIGQGGTNPSHMCAWDKITLGWAVPSIASSRQNVSLSYVETNASMLKIPIQNGLPQEYFLVEYRSPTSGAQFDRYIPGTGLLVWHIDDAITSSRGINVTSPMLQNTVNTGLPHYGVSIVTADGASISQTGGDAGNAFGNGVNFITPRSDTFGGQPSGISLVNISGVGSPTVATQVANLVVTAGQTISKLVNFPNPAGKGYAHPNGEGHTTIQAQITRPAGTLGINIYTLNGDLVRKVGLDEVNLNLDRSADAKWVYEFVWDLKNGDGDMVSPGVYLYLVRADGVSKSGKLVIIR